MSTNFSKNVIYSLVSVLLTGIIVASLVIFYLLISLPNVTQLKDTHFQVPLKIYTADNKLIAEFGEKKRTPVELKQVPKLLVRAIIDTEDQRFYEHNGVDFIGLIRAFKNLIITGKKSEGASTITMQVARNFFLSPEKTYLRKFKEILLAFKIDHQFGKDDILELYLNKVYFGQRAYGVAAAAQVYYGKSLNDLTLPEIAMLAGLPQAPSRDNPLSNLKAAIERRNHVLKRMLDNRDIDLATYRTAIKVSSTADYHSQNSEVYAPYVAEMARAQIIGRYGDDAYDQGLKVFTTIDSRLQTIANQKILEGLIAYTKRHTSLQAEETFNRSTANYQTVWVKRLQNLPIYSDLHPAVVLKNNGNKLELLLANGSKLNVNVESNLRTGDVIRLWNNHDQWEAVNLPKVNGALVTLNPQSGAIVDLVGGFSYAKDNFNCAIQADRQPGSSLKPFIYSAALEKDYTLASVINDAPIVVNDYGRIWRPQNFTHDFRGPTRVRVALVGSVNMVSIRLLQAIGIPYAIEYLQRFGFPQRDLPPSLSLALGTAMVSPLELASAYAVFANDGYRIVPYFIDHVTDNHDQVILRVTPYKVPANADPLASTSTSNQIGPFAPQVITPQNVFLMTDVMKEIIKHITDEFHLNLQRSDLAGKTGTTNQQQDTWFAGFNRDLVTVVWLGYNIPQSLYEYGVQASFPIWLNFMQEALQGKPEAQWSQPEGIVSAKIDPVTGLLAYPEQTNAIFEMFYQANVPTEQATPEGDAQAIPFNGDNLPSSNSANDKPNGSEGFELF